MEHWTTKLNELEAESRRLRELRALTGNTNKRRRLTAIIDANEAEIQGIRGDAVMTEFPQDDRRALESVFSEDDIASMLPPRRVCPNGLYDELRRQKAIALATSKRQPKKKMRGRKGRQHKRHKK